MASREFAEIEIIGEIAERKDVAVGIIDVKSYYVETPEDVADRVRLCLKYAPAERLSLAPDCGLSQTARWAARRSWRTWSQGVRSGAGGARACDRAGARRRRVPGRRRGRTRRGPRRCTLWWLGQSGFLLRWQGRAPAARPVPVRLADAQVRRHRPAARAHDRARRRAGAARLRRRRHLEPQPHRPPRRRDARPAPGRRARRCRRGGARGQPRVRRRAARRARRRVPVRACDDGATVEGRRRRAHRRPRRARAARARRARAAAATWATSSGSARGPSTTAATRCCWDGLDERSAGRSRSTSRCCRSTAATRPAAWPGTSTAPRRRGSPRRRRAPRRSRATTSMFAFNTASPDAFVAECGAARAAVPRARERRAPYRAPMTLAPAAPHLLARTARAQLDGRVPSLVAGVVRDGALAWWAGRGSTDPTTAGGRVPDAGTQYRIGSLTKTFTAVLVLRLRDEGRLSLDDPLDRHLPGTAFGDRTIGQLLSHGAGIGAETGPPWWERSAGRAWDAVVAGLDEGLPFGAGRRFHYSNLGYGALGELVTRLRGRPWAACLAAEVLEPSGCDGRRSARAARRSRLRGPPVGGPAHPRPEHDAGAMAPAGQPGQRPQPRAVGRVPPRRRRRRARRGDARGDARAGARRGLGRRLVGLRPRAPGLERRRRAAPGRPRRVDARVPGLPRDRPRGVRTAALALASATTGLDRSLTGDLLALAATHAPAVPGRGRRPPARRRRAPRGRGLVLGTRRVRHALGGDGVLELFVALGAGGRGTRFRRDAAGRWRGLRLLGRRGAPGRGRGRHDVARDRVLRVRPRPVRRGRADPRRPRRRRLAPPADRSASAASTPWSACTTAAFAVVVRPRLGPALGVDPLR